MKKLKNKVYSFKTIDQDGHIESYQVDASSIKEARKLRNEIIGNSQTDEKVYGHIYINRFYM